ncbi:hypothetical protein CPter91_4756 [Collimonas pratensis]|uniref:Uncharacterized protein n=1 Tax=Collimonas pratensis TaxID=279113 RepID=A0A127QAM6_9BURK|nr:hypothetical protein CPter91_4756 [Collimonas pratensis]
MLQKVTMYQPFRGAPNLNISDSLPNDEYIEVVAKICRTNCGF